jgi:hypothetical protein
MAKSKIPGPLERRHLIERELSNAQALAVAEAYLEDERVLEAVDFLAKADAQDRLDEVAQSAVASGDLFLLQAVHRARGDEPSPEELEQLGAAAESAGRESYAASARRLARRGRD